MRRIIFTLVLLGLVTLRARCADTAPKPNFILILADDLGYGDIGPFGSTKNRTPNLDRMAREGLRLTSFYGAPVCTPSRAQILTGSYAKRVSLPQVLSPAAAIGLSTNEHCIAELLKQQGYATIAIGKWHVGDHPDFLPTRHGFDHYFGLPYSNDMGGREATDAAAVTANRRDTRPPLPLLRDGEVIETISSSAQDRLTERYTDEAVKFIQEHKSGPFFLYLPHTAVHTPLHPGAKFRGKSANGLYGDWVEELDWSVGRVLDTVRELGLADHTLVIFSSDNGPWLTQGINGGEAGPLRGGKGGTYEGGVREPTLAWWPGKIPGRAASDAVAANFDLLPTFVKLAGGTLPADNKIDGRDIAPLFFGQSQESPHEAHFYFAGNQLQAVRSGPWKLAVARQSENLFHPPGAPVVRPGRGPFTPTLYNLDTDIGERHDVAAQHPEVVIRLQALVARMDADLGVEKLGPGVRPPGRVSHPVGLWLAGQEPSPDLLAAHYDAKPLDKLAIGEVVEHDEAPQIADKELTISAEVEPKTREGVIVAQGGSAFGYALHLHEGRPVFTVREEGQPVFITASEAPAGRFRLQAHLARNGALTLAVDGKIVATGRVPGLISAQPQENFCVGFDDGQAVGDYDGAQLFAGTIEHLRVVAE
jgi:arylsulfatase A-like enzyme